MSINSVELILTIFVTVSAILFGFYGVIFTLYCSYLLQTGQNGHITPPVRFLGFICKSIFWLLAFNCLFVIFSLVVYCFVPTPPKELLYIFALAIVLVVLYIVAISYYISKRLESFRE